MGKIKVLKVDEKILLAFLNKDNPINRDEISQSGINKGSVGAYLQRLKKEGLIEKVEHGKYILTDKGKQEVEKIKQYAPKNILIKSEDSVKLNISDNKIIDLEDIPTILTIKQQYGREKLLKIIDNIKRLIE